jgi:hypothetical protein
MDPDPDANPDPVIFVGDLQDINKNLKVHLHQFSKMKSQKEVRKQ